jgi:hypothetical protein
MERLLLTLATTRRLRLFCWISLGDSLASVKKESAWNGTFARRRTALDPVTAFDSRQLKSLK